MKAAILGGGLTGVLAALMVAERGGSVALFDREPALMRRASTANEGKIHLGYVYGADPDFATASVMVDDALCFRPILERFISAQAFEALLIEPFRYYIPPDTQRPAAALRAHFERVDETLKDRLRQAGRRYIDGAELAPCVFRAAEDRPGFTIVDTPERGVWPEGLAAALIEAVAAHPRIEVRTEAEIDRVIADGARWRVELAAAPGARAEGPFDAVLNAAWAGRRPIDRRSGFADEARWYTRFKFGVLLDGARARFGDRPPRNGTGTLGLYGDSAYYPQSDQLYCSWYPVGRCFATTGAFDLDRPALTGQTRQMAEATYAGYATLDPAYDALADRLEDGACRLIGDYILAQGASDIEDPNSGLHRRASHGPARLARGYWTLETGKYVSAPRVAEQAVAALFAEAV